MSKLRLTKWQLISVSVCYMLGSILHMSDAGAVAKQDSWIIPFTGLLMFAPAVIVYCLLVKLHPGEGLYEINETALGKPLGKLFTFLYMLFFFHVSTLNTMQVEVFVANYLLQSTPVMACGVLMMAFCAFAIHRGLNAVVIGPFAFCLISGAYLVINFIQGIPQMRPELLQPIMVQEPEVYLRASHIEAAIMYGEIIGMLTLAGILDKKAKFSTCLVITMVISCLYLALIHLRERMLLGDLTPYLSLPAFEAVRMLAVNSTSLSRMESLYSLIMIAYSIFRALITFWATLSALKSIFELKSYTSLILPVGALITIYTTRIYFSPSDSFFYSISTSPFLWSVFVFILPLITLLFAAVRKLASKLSAAKFPEQATEPNGSEGF